MDVDALVMNSNKEKNFVLHERWNNFFATFFMLVKISQKTLVGINFILGSNLGALQSKLTYLWFEKPRRSFETKWRMIKHDITKFVGHYGAMVVLCEFRTSTKDILHKVLKLFKSNHLDNQSSHFIHSWFILKDEPKWTNFQEDMKKTTYLKWRTFAK